MNKAVFAQYALAGVAMFCLVAVNIWGVADDTLNAVLVGTITTTAWGARQRGTID